MPVRILNARRVFKATRAIITRLNSHQKAIIYETMAEYSAWRFDYGCDPVLYLAQRFLGYPWRCAGAWSVYQFCYCNSADCPSIECPCISVALTAKPTYHGNSQFSYPDCQLSFLQHFAISPGRSGTNIYA